MTDVLAPASAWTGFNSGEGERAAPAEAGEPRPSVADAPQFDLEAEAVAARFEQAARSGEPAWLWPDIPRAGWRRSLGSIERTARAVLAGRAPQPLTGDLEALSLAAYTSGLGPLIGWWSEHGVIETPAPLGALFAAHLTHNGERAALMAAQAVRIISSLCDAGVPVVVLKGAHTALAYFPHPSTRPASDIDLLVAPADEARAAEVLQGCGLVQSGRSGSESSWRLPGAARLPRSLLLAHAEDPWSVDLHTSLDVPVGPGARPAALDRLDPLESDAPWPPCPRARVLEQPGLTLHLAVHAGAGRHNLTLLRLVELVLLIRNDTAHGRLRWESFVEAGGRTRALGRAWPALRLCEDLAPGTVPPAVLAACEAAAPRAVRRRVSGLTPAGAQQIGGGSLAEHLMWVEGPLGLAKLLAADLLPGGRSLQQNRQIWRRRAVRLFRRRVPD